MPAQKTRVTQHKIRSTALRLRRPPQATADQVHISRGGEYATIEHADTAYGKRPA